MEVSEMKQTTVKLVARKDGISDAIAELDVLADFLMSSEPENLKQHTIPETGLMISKLIDRLKVLTDWIDPNPEE